MIPRGFKVIKKIKMAIAAVSVFMMACSAALAQTLTPGLPVIPMGYCQLSATALGSAVGFSSCVRAAFTASAGTDTTQLVVTSVTGIIKRGDQIISGTGLTAGTIIVGQISGTPGGAGTYQLNAVNSASSASVTSGGIPTDAQGHTPNMVVIAVDTAAVRWRDDGAIPTTALGIEIPSAGIYTYAGTMSAIKFIAVSGSPVLNAAFYRTSSP